MVHFKGKRYSCSCPNGTCDMNCRMYRIAAGKPSNADRIRAMTDEELAEWITHCVDESVGLALKGAAAKGTPTKEIWLDWLNKEVDG